MWIQVRSMDGKTSHCVKDLSKLTKIEELREKLEELFDASANRQRLFYRGKQLEDGHSLYDYSVVQNDIVQLLVRPVPKPVEKEEVEHCKVNGDVSSGDEGASDKENQEPLPGNSQDSGVVDDDSTYKVGDIVDVRDDQMGAWFEAMIVKVEKAQLSDEDIQEPDSENMKIENKPKIEKDEAIDENCNTKLTENKEVKETTSALTDKQNKETIDVEMMETTSGIGCDVTDGVKPKVMATILDDETTVKDDGYRYHVKFEGYENDDPVADTVKSIRPRASVNIPFKEVKVGDKVMVNYNYDAPKARGYWYDCIVTEKRDTRTIKELYATIFLGPDLAPLENCQILYIDEIMAIGKPGAQLNMSQVESGVVSSPTKRTNKPECDHCQDNPRRKCKFCSCAICGGKNDPEKQIMCDECDAAYHIGCLTPPLEAIPDVEEWYCPECKNDDTEVVRAGEKLKESKKKAKMASATTSSSRDWGKGMACVGRTKMCTIVPPNHFGPIPGVEVGTAWKFRVQCSEAGVHRPHVAGIHGREEEGAYSIVLSGGYEDDHDNGDNFTYTGSGGRDLSGNKRTAEQSCDQLLTRMNAALAKCCNAKFDKKNGGEAEEWKGGKPVRVVRNVKGRKHSKYAPVDGNRYDGIYKITRYWPEKGKSGYLVWRYELRRDDPSPAPWTKEGKKRIAQLGLTMQYPDGYLEAQAEKEKEKDNKGKGKGKRKRGEDEESDKEDISPKKKSKVAAYKVDAEVAKLIKDDTENKKLWDDAMTHVKEGAQKFLANVEEIFLCICCQDIVFKPVTVKCSHNICKQCLSRSFKAEVYSCPACREELGKDYSLATNATLGKILNRLFPGYENGR
ncbi:E3 ubiquitin-protein ligase UHRF1-like [Lineus longissimus]|uniref:E3 ubiquitin-protein ligase UHRF1-like n=1 Tax=Lineus longissimus TaxID=88925 RepID=UPI002B4C2F2A